MKIQDFQDNVTCGGFDNIFANIYKPQDIESQKSRYMSAVEKFTALYPNRNDIHVILLQVEQKSAVIIPIINMAVSLQEQLT